MYCLSCGKKISKISKYCKYCGVSQKEKIIGEQEKNKKLFLNSNPKKAWFTLWVTTVLTFILSLFICIKYTDSKITLLSGKYLMYLFLLNILMGVFAFLAFAISNNQSKNNKISFFTKYIFSICLIYLFVNPFVFAAEGYRALSNPEYGKKYQDITNSNQPKLSKESITLQNLSWKSEVFSGTILNSNNRSVFNVRIILKVSRSRDIWNVDETHEILVPYKIDAGQTYNFSEKISTKKTNPWWTTEVISADFYNGENIITPIPTSKPKTKSSNIRPETNSGSIECIGPDGKSFNTTLDECKSLNAKWGKTADYYVNCQIGGNCPSETRRLKKSECDNGTCCQIGSSWIFYLSNSKCDEDQANYTKGTSGNTGNTSGTVISNSPKVQFQATETSVKGTYYCYEDKVNTLVTEQSYVNTLRELYEGCTSSSYNKSIYMNCMNQNSCNSDINGDCFKNCYDLGYGKCDGYDKNYLSEKSKLDTMRYQYCP